MRGRHPCKFGESHIFWREYLNNIEVGECETKATMTITDNSKNVDTAAIIMLKNRTSGFIAAYVFIGEGERSLYAGVLCF